MSTRRAFLKSLAGLGVGSLLAWDLILPKTAISSSLNLSDQQTNNTSKAKLSFVVVSDIHINRFKAVRNFSALLIDNYNSKPDAMVVVGDLGDGVPRHYNILNNVLNQHNLMINYPIFWTIGNHEFYGAFYRDGEFWSPKGFPNKEKEAIAIERFLTFAKREKVYGDAWVNDYHLIFLGSEKSRMSDRNYMDAALLSEAQLDWLESTLKNDCGKNKPIFVFLHQPIPYLTEGGFQHGYVLEWKRLNDILSLYPEVILFNGHIHFEIEHKYMLSEAKYTIVNSSSLACPIDRHRKPIKNSAPGFVVEVYDDKVTIRGKDFLKQSRIPDAKINVENAWSPPTE